MSGRGPPFLAVLLLPASEATRPLFLALSTSAIASECVTLLGGLPRGVYDLFSAPSGCPIKVEQSKRRCGDPTLLVFDGPGNKGIPYLAMDFLLRRVRSRRTRYCIQSRASSLTIKRELTICGTRVRPARELQAQEELQVRQGSGHRWASLHTS